jgi:hypothetical protein
MKIPERVEVTKKLIDRGEQRFNIYCSPCHDRTGSGHGIVWQRGYNIQPTNLTDDTRLLRTDGELFETISYGRPNMPQYRVQIPVADRWAIVAWIRVLQQSQHASIEDVPETMRNKIEPELDVWQK